MSHVTDVKLCVKDLDAVEDVAARLGGVLRRGQRTFAWYGRWVGDYHGTLAAVDQGFDPRTFGRCDHAIRLKDHQAGDYEIGLVRDPDGQSWRLLYDSWGEHGRKLERAFGPQLKTFRREYAYTVQARRTKAVLGPKGWTQQREDLPNGRIRLRLRKR